MRNASRAAGFTLLEILVVVAILMVISLIAAPLVDRTVDSFKIVGTARGVTNALSVAKIRAASSYTRVRLFVDLSTGSHRVQRLNRSTTPPSWENDGVTTFLPAGVTFSFGDVDTPPPDSQTTIGQAPQCLNNASPPVPIGNTACIVFNSRGIPIDPTLNTPLGTDALYLTDGIAVYGITAAATGMIRLWRTYELETPTWVLQ